MTPRPQPAVPPFEWRDLADLYLWLSVAFSTPNKSLLSPGYASLARECASTLLADPNPIALPTTQEGSEEARFLALQREYARLFIGPQKALVRPYESCYFGEDRLMSERSLAVRGFYESTGFGFDGLLGGEPPDHIAVELDYLSMVCSDLTGSRPEEVENTEQRFLSEHLGAWGHQFATQVIECTDEPFYKTAATLLDRLLQRRLNPTAP